MTGRALIIGNSDGIGLALTRRLLADGWHVAGLSRSASPIDDDHYRHTEIDVTYPEYSRLLAKQALPDLCVYCAGIGEPFDPANMEMDVETFEVNLNGMVRTTAVLIPPMIKAGGGHFVGLSSLADSLPSREAPAYGASKSGFSRYLLGLAPAIRPHGVAVTNIRFGFVDTKMAKSDVRPFMMTCDRAVEHIMACVRKRPVQFTAPKRMAAVIGLLRVGRWFRR